MRFTPEDFKNKGLVVSAESNAFQLLAEIANAKLEELLKEAPTVYLNRKNTAPKVHALYWTEYKSDLTLDGPVTHKARLVQIEPIDSRLERK